VFLGLDIGTSGVKAAIVNETGKLVAQSSAPLQVSRPKKYWSEQDPGEWWNATNKAVALLESSLRAKIQAVGLSGQMHGAVLLNDALKPLRPAILWNDGRSTNECSYLETNCRDLREISGNAAMPGFTAPKLLWVRRHEPKIFERLEKVILPKDFIRLLMTGEVATDVSDAAGTLWLDTSKREWSEVLLDACGLALSQMPSLFEGTEITGTLLPEVAARWGMQRVPVVGGGGDNAAAAAGLGVVQEDKGLLSLGTSGTIFLPTKRFAANPSGGVHAFCHCVPNMWHLMSVHLSAASCLAWLANLVGLEIDELLAGAQRYGPARDGELFLPYLSGERTPHNDSQIRSAFIGLGHETGPDQLAASVLEGVAFAFRDGMDALSATGTPVESLTIAGGGARSEYWGKILASAIDKPLHYLEGSEIGPALGAAKLAMAGTTDLSLDQIFTRPRVKNIIEPCPKLQNRMSSNLEHFRRAYPALKAI
jgi:xylulokinase